MTIRKDKQKNIDKVAASLAKNPLQTEAEIAKDTGVSQSAVNRAKDEVGKTGLSDIRIQSLLDGDVEIMKTIQKEKARRLNEEKEKLNNSDIDKWEQTATKRHAIFGTDNGEDKGDKTITIQI